MSTSADPASAETTTRRAGTPIYKRRRRRIYGIAGVVVVLVIALIVTQLMVLLRKYTELSPAGLTQLINRDTPLLIDLSAIIPSVVIRSRSHEAIGCRPSPSKPERGARQRLLQRRNDR